MLCSDSLFPHLFSVSDLTHTYFPKRNTVQVYVQPLGCFKYLFYSVFFSSSYCVHTLSGAHYAHESKHDWRNTNSPNTPTVMLAER